MTTKVGIIGYGKIGRLRKQLVDNNKNTELFGVFDPYQRPELIPDGGMPLQDLVSGSDLVLVCTPHSENAGMAAAVMTAGKHLGLEKPMATDYGTAHNLLAYQTADKQAMVFMNHRWHDSVMHALTELPRLGSVMWVRGVYGKYELENWRTDRERAGRGILLSQGIHMVDLFRQFVKGELQVVGAIADEANGIERDVMALLRGSNGERISLHSSALLWKNTFRLEVGCEHGYLTLDGLITSTRSFGFAEKLVVGGKPNQFYAKGNPPEQTFYFDKDPSYKREFDYLVDCIVGGEKVEICSLDDALETMRLVQNIYDKCDER